MEDPSIYVQAIYSFKGKNNDELCFKKGQIITITQREEGGWWEGTLNEKTGWFPSNYVTDYRPHQGDNIMVTSCGSGSTSPNQLPLPIDLAVKQQQYRGVVVTDLMESEKAHIEELRTLVTNYLRPLKCSEILSNEEYARLAGNTEDVLAQHSQLLSTMEEEGASSGTESIRVGRLFLSSAPTIGDCLLAYCNNHPLAVAVIEKHRDALNAFMESRGAHQPGLLVLTAGLSKPFRRLDKYQGLLQEVLRHLPEADVDRGDTQRAVTVYKELATRCSTARRQRQLQLEVISGGVRGWEGEDVSTLGEIVHMGSVAVGPSHSDRYLVLFPRTLLVLAVSARMSGFIYQGKLPLSAIHIKKLEDSDIYKNAFEISGPMIETIVAACQTRDDQLRWLELLQQYQAGTHSTGAPNTLRERALSGSNQQQAVSTMAVAPHHSINNRMTCSPLSHTHSSSPPVPISPPLPRAVSVGSSPLSKTPSVSGAAEGQPSPPPHQIAIAPQSGPRGHAPLLGGWSLSCLRPAPPLKAGLCLGTAPAQDHATSRSIRRRDERSFEEDAQILGVIEAYCLSSKTRHTLNSSLLDSPQILIAEDEKIIVEEEAAGSHTIVEERSLVDTVYALKDQVRLLASQLSCVNSRLDSEEGHRSALEATVNSLLHANKEFKVAVTSPISPSAESKNKDS